MSAIALKGMTWRHPRGLAPLQACSRLWRDQTGVSIAWDARSLQDFEAYPIEELAARYDLVVIDHPHVGHVSRQGCLAPLDEPERAEAAAALRKASVGKSFASYRWQDRQWALPIDAATQVQAWRPDLIPAPAPSWSAVTALACDGAALCPMRPPHGLMTFYALCGNLGRPCDPARPQFVDQRVGAEAYTRLAELVALIDPVCYVLDPIAALEAMAAEDSRIACIPLVYGYVSYAAQGFRPRRIAFADMPAVGDAGPVGTPLGGTGIAVSAQSAHRREATDFAFWIASGAVQAGPYAQAGGQPAHADAWESEAVNAPVLGFYRATRRTLEGAWVRPRHDGAMAFQNAASARLIEALQARESATSAVAALNALFAASLSRR